MKHKKMITGLFLIGFMALSTLIVPITAKAEGGTLPYTYTVKFYIGSSDIADDPSTEEIDESTVFSFKDGSKCMTYTGLKYGDPLPFSPAFETPFNPQDVNIATTNHKYAVKGIRRSGENDLVTDYNKTVTGDETYVIAYAVGTLVPYTVQFFDEDGVTKLMEDLVLYGVEGEELWIGVRYYQDYGIKSADNYVKSLESGHVFKFVYTKNPQGTAGTIYNTTERTSYSTVTGEPEYTYQVIPREPVPLAGGGATNNRGEGGVGAGEVGAEEAGEGEGGGAGGTTTIGEGEVPLDGGESIEIPPEEPPKRIDVEEVRNKYIRYLIIVAIVGMMIVLTSIIGTYKIEHDKNKRN